MRVSEDALVVTTEGRSLIVRLVEVVRIGDVDRESLVTDTACEEVGTPDMLRAGLLVVVVLLVLDIGVVELLCVNVD